VRISGALNGVTTLAIETAPFIYFVEQHPTYVDRMRAIFYQVNSGTPQVVTSVITLTEVLVMPIQTGHIQYQQAYREMLLNTAHITTISVSSAIADRAASLRVQYGLRTPDALHVATALISGCGAFLTNDFGLKRVQDVRVLVLDELELDE
jgi:predicted nucleic acid-binding protein